MDLIWAPQVISNLKESDLRLYLEFASSACVLGGGCSTETALKVLYDNHGDIKAATRSLLLGHIDFWTESEIHQFKKLISVHGKNFPLISAGIKTKTVKQCVQFYYTSKKSSSSPATLPAQLPQPTIQNPSATSLPNQQASSILALTPPNSESSSVNTSKSTTDEFPCKVCGRVFEKIKSRSAHMKRHKNER